MLSFFVDIYNVVNKDGLVGCFILFKSAYRIGDEILGIFDFRECKVKCTKVSPHLLKKGLERMTEQQCLLLSYLDRSLCQDKVNCCLIEA
jgi:hypothetical protein